MVYVIQTETGREEENLLFMKALLSGSCYTKSFVLKAEWLKRLGGEWKLQTRPLFPGYLFIETESAERLFLELKKVPKLTKLLGDGQSEFVPLQEGEEGFFRLLMKSGSDTICLSELEVSEAGEILSMDGALEAIKKDIQRLNLRKRYAVVRAQLLGEERTMILGIRLSKDCISGNTVEKERSIYCYN